MSKFKKTMLLVSCTTMIAATTIFSAASYTLQSGDTLDIQILNKKELSTRQLISPDGTISLPLIGRQKVTGKTLEAVDTQLKSQFTPYFENPLLVVQLDKLTKPDSTGSYFVSVADPSKGTVEVKTAKSLSEAMAWTAGNPFKAYRFSSNGQRVSLSSKDSVLPGDTIVVSNIRIKPDPIYLVFQDQSKNTFELKKAESLKEALAWTAGHPYELIKANLSPSASSQIEPGDTLKVTIGKADDWWGDNWYKVLSAVGVVVGLLNSIHR